MNQLEPHVHILMSSTWVRTPLLYALLFFIVLARFFTETIQVLPGFLGFGDVALLGLFPIVCLLRLVVFRKPLRLTGVWLPVAVFVGLTGLSAVLNSVLYGNPVAPALTFLLFFLEPILFAVVFVNLGWRDEDSSALTTAFVVLALLQVVTGLSQIPLALETANSDVVAGTFGKNGSQMDFFLALTGGYMVGRYLIERRLRWLVALPPMLAVYYANGFKAMWVALPVTVCFVVLFFVPVRPLRKVALVTFVLVSAGAAALLVGRRTTEATMSYFGDVFSAEIMKIGKLQAGRNVLALYGQAPFAAILGVGPGSYSSRSFQYFTNLSAEQGGTMAFSDLGGMLPQYGPSQWAERFVIPVLLKGGEAQLGSWTMDGPYSSYLGLLAEVGIAGLMAFLWIHIRVLGRVLRVSRAAWHARDARRFGTAVASLIGLLFLAQMGLWDNWFEVARVTVPLWLMLVPILSERMLTRSGNAEFSG